MQLAARLAVAVVVVILCYKTSPLAAQTAKPVGPTLTPDERQRLAEADKLYARQMELASQGQYRVALELARQVVAVRTELLGDEHWRTVDARMALTHAALLDRFTPEQRQAAIDAEHRNDRIVQLWRAKKYAEALPLAQENLRIREALLGEFHVDTAQSVGNVAAQHQGLRNYAAALPLFQRALVIREQLLGTEHPRTAESRVSLAYLYELQSNYAAALPLHERALATFERTIGPEHPQTVICLNNLAVFLQDQGDYAQSRLLFRRALAIREKVLGPTHPEVAAVLNNLGVVRKLQGDYAEALSLHQRALAIYEKTSGPVHPGTALSLGGLASAYGLQGRYAQALPLLQRALLIREKTLGPMHHLTAESLNNLAALHNEMGNDAEALSLYQRALAIREKTLGPDSPVTAHGLHNMAVMYGQKGKVAQALSLYERALAIQEKALGPDHPDIAHVLNSIGLLNQRQGKDTEALPQLERALAIREQTLGPEHSSVAASLAALARSYRTLGNDAEALRLCQRALAINEQSLGPQHNYTAITLHDLADLYQSLGNFREALPLFQRALAIMRRLVDLTADVQSERQQLTMAGNLRIYLDSYLDCLLSSGNEGGVAYAEALTWKGAVLARQRTARLARAGGDPELAQTLTELQTTAGRLAAMVFATPPVERRAAWQREIAELTKEKENLEGKLSGLSGEFRREQAQRQLTGEALQRVLPADVALVDFLEFWHASPPQKGRGTPRRERRLAAFIVTNDRPVRFFDLGPASAIAVAVDAWRKDFGAGGAVGLDLRRLVWDPLAPSLTGMKAVLVSPDGALARLPLAALPGSKPGTFLIEDVAIAVIPVPNMLPEMLADTPNLEPTTQNPSLLLVGNVDFGALPGTAMLSAKARSAPRGTAADPLRTWLPLDGTGSEALAVQESFARGYRQVACDLLQQTQATEEQVRQLAPRHRFLHLATHGFFASPQVRSALGARIDDSRSDSGTLVGYHPGLLSGLVLAGANRPVEPDKDDGILTALEVAELDLSGVELATLSACETGLGESAGGEGLLGLQRAFQVAGAQSTVASLWQVPDQATRSLMTRFYENLWQKKLPKLEALRQAQVWMLREGIKQPELWRGQGELVDFVAPTEAWSKTPDRPGLPPRYWAAFVLSGDWR